MSKKVKDALLMSSFNDQKEKESQTGEKDI
jgi:hypothetical protein